MTVEWAPLEPEPTGHNTLNYTEQGGEVTHIGGTLIIEEGAHVEALSLPSGRLQYQDDSTATTVAALRDDFNDLLMRLKQSGLMDEGEVTVC